MSLNTPDWASDPFHNLLFTTSRRYPTLLTLAPPVGAPATAPHCDHASPAEIGNFFERRHLLAKSTGREIDLQFVGVNRSLIAIVPAKYHF